MGILKKRSRASGEIPTASMADIAFLLLIFFLVTTIFDEQKGLSIVLPERGEDVEIPARNILHLVIQPDGIVEVQRGESPQIQQATSAMIAAIWRTEVAENPNLIAAVKTAPGAPYRYMVDVLDQLQVAGATRVNLGILE
jgi:biopolymer transport protein ExbD